MKPKYMLNSCLISIILMVLSACVLSTVGVVAIVHGIVV